MTSSPSLGEVLEALQDKGFHEVEVYHKRGRSRRLEHSLEGKGAVFTEEEGWAVRAGDRRRSFYCAGTGPPRPGGPWPEADGTALRLPDPVAAPQWSPPEDLDSPLVGESEGRSLLSGVAQTLTEEANGARLLAAVLEDGSSEVELLNSHEIKARYRSRIAAIHLEAAWVGEETTATSIRLAERQARDFRPLALARRLADRLWVAKQGQAPRRDRGEMLLSPEVGSHLLRGLEPLFVGAEARSRLESLRNRRGRIGGAALTLIDDGRLRGGVLEAPVDGEGVATGKSVLVEEGVLHHPLLPWWEARESRSRVTGCRLRTSWRSLPETGPTHLYLKPDAGVRVSSLLAEVARGYYFIGTTGTGAFDLDEGRFSIPVIGFAVRGGKPAGPVAGAWLCGGIRALFHGIQAVARDLSFFPLGSMLGSPSLLVTGLEVRGGR